VQGTRQRVDPVADQVPRRARRFGSEGDVDGGFRPREQLRGDERPRRVFASTTGVETVQTCCAPGSDDRAHGRGGTAEDQGEMHDVVADEFDSPPRIDAVRREEQHAGALGRGEGRPTGPIQPRRPCGEGCEHGVHRGGGKVVRHLNDEGRRAPSADQSR
jgi:hypothetical protein